ncbi:hypothetical protein B0T21DRAFT_360242 [Apiosordaria backusii]|uniref:CFEM domain-containing protein n=1 Tax=Apiosordaria backusii TaxID=314023 RepID=A0AA40EM32_9PEZI|nr:hypothetical protein B0T21DRAFT_360242 [Apiosordaria backusii]
MKPLPISSFSLPFLTPSSVFLLLSLSLILLSPTPCQALSLFQPFLQAPQPPPTPHSLSSSSSSLQHGLGLEQQQQHEAQASSPPPNTTDLIAQLSRNIPPCALDCVVELTNITTECLEGSEGTSDQVCLCSDDVSHYTRVLGCVQKKCTMEESIGQFYSVPFFSTQ